MDPTQDRSLRADDQCLARTAPDSVPFPLDPSKWLLFPGFAGVWRMEDGAGFSDDVELARSMIGNSGAEAVGFDAHSMRKTVIDRFPSPAAVAFAHAQATRSMAARLEHTLQAAEATLGLLGSIVLADACDTLRRDGGGSNPRRPKLRVALDQLRLQEASLGTWVFVLERVTLQLDQSFVVELGQLCADQVAWRQALTAMELLREERNEGLGHRFGRGGGGRGRGRS